MTTADKLISIKQAAKLGIERLRRPIWAMPQDHVKIVIYAGLPGPWLYFFSPSNLLTNSVDPVKISCTNIDYDSEEWLPYNGPLNDSQEYLDMQAKCSPQAWNGANKK